MLILRQTLDGDSVYADVALHASGLTSLQFRDEKGALVRRVHCFGAGRFERTYAAIPRHMATNGLGYLTGKVLTATDRGQKYLRAAVSHSGRPGN